MDTLASSIIKQPWFISLGKRSSTFFQMVKHLDKFQSGTIIETGCAWCKDNWNGQGQSTLIWDWVLSQKSEFNCTSIDITPEHVAISKSQTKLIHYVCGDSVGTLNDMPEETLANCRLLYLDSFDWYDELNVESAFHHMAELAAVWRFIPSGCMIVVDDRHGQMRGKHWLVEGFMSKLNISPTFCDYQIGWVKP